MDKITTDGANSQIYNFSLEDCNCLAAGSTPDGGVTLGTDRNLYGTTMGGGTYNAGTIFEIAPEGHELHCGTFTTETEGSTTKPPYFPAIEGQDGNFYGVVSGGERAVQRTFRGFQSEVRYLSDRHRPQMPLPREWSE